MFELVIRPQKLLWQDELNPRVRCAFGNVFELSKLTLIPGGKVAMLLAVRNCSKVGRSSPRGARRPRGTP